MIRLAQIFENKPQFPSRSHENVSSYLKRLLESPKINLSSKEKKLLFEFEEKLTRSENLNQDIEDLIDENVSGIELVWEKQIQKDEFFLEYFVSPEGKEDAEEFLHAVCQSVDQVRDLLLTKDFSNSEKSRLHDVAERSRMYVEARILREFEEGEFQKLDGIKNPQRIRIIYNPDVLRDKVVLYRRLTKWIDGFVEKNNEADSLSIARERICSLFMRRVEHLLAESYAMCLDVALQSEYRGELEKIVQDIHEVIPVLKISKETRHEYISRVDKFIYGVTKSGSVLSDNVLELFELDAQKKIVGKYSEEKANSVIVDAEIWQRWAKKALRRYDVLSIEDDSLYLQGRGTRAKDERWQVVVQSVASPRVDSKEGVLRVPGDMRRSLAGSSHVGAVASLDHEIAHIVQHENRARIPLAVCDNVGFARRAAMAEAGAVYWETVCAAEFFGKVRVPFPHYARAIEARERGGDYLQCMKAFFESVVLLDPEVSKVGAARLAINRVMRIFRNSGDFADTSGRVFSSKVLVYSEQDIIATELSKKGYVYLLFVGGVNLFTLSILHSLGLFDKDLVWVPEKRPSEIVEGEVMQLVSSLDHTVSS